MSKFLYFLSAVWVFSTVASVAHADADATRTTYEEAQALKRSNHFSEAKEAFQRASESSGAGDSKWAALAADELRYGLPLFEANHLSVQLAGKTDFPTQRRILQQLEALYQTILEHNVDNPERISATEQRRDQLINMRQAIQLMEQSSNTAEQRNTEINLQRLRRWIAIQRKQTGQWPDRRRLEQELTQTALHAGLAGDRFYIADYYPSSTSFFLTIRDTQGGAETKIKGDENGVTLERTDN